MERQALSGLLSWLAGRGRLPLVVRGGRQVGKTWLVRELARRSGRVLAELNFEYAPRDARLFDSNDPKQIVQELSVTLNRNLDASASLLFLDEIQAAPELLSKLRWFAEQLPELPVVAAGSLLEFALSEPKLSMPVGRIGYQAISPMTFAEFLQAHGQQRLLEHMEAWKPGVTSSLPLHEKALHWFDRYSMVGGMPAVVAADVAGRPASELRRLQRDLVRTFRDDFAKYSRRFEPRVLDAMLLAAVRMLGRKFVAARVGDGLKHHAVSASLELLCRAHLCHQVLHTAANGLPLGAEAKPRLRKLLLLDVGLAHGLLGTPAVQAFPKWKDLGDQVRAQVVEQTVGQQLHALAMDSDGTSRLYYWQREGGRAGEIDYLLPIATRIVPVELKSGAAGAMKSLHQFMFDKKLNLAVRLDRNPPSVQQLDLKTTQGNRVRYTLVNLPHYLVRRLPALVASL